MRIDFLISNPNHHLQMILPIIRHLQAEGKAVRVLSLCEFRRMSTPAETLRSMSVAYHVLPGFKATGLKPSSGQRSLGQANSWRRRTIHTLVWRWYLRPAWRKVFKDQQTQAVFLLNDFAYPNAQLVHELHQLSIPFYLLQEGIRFPLPNESGSHGFGTMGARQIIAWGEKSAAYFRGLRLHPNTEVLALGCPRFDTVLQADRQSDVRQIEEAYAPAAYTLGFFSNPIDDQGFCSTAQKLQLVQQFLRRSLPLVRSLNGRIWIKLHPRENEDDFQALIASFQAGNHIQLVRGNIFTILSMVDSAVVLASTVGLEALLFSRPLGVLGIYEHGFVFDYVSEGAAVGLDVEHADFDEKLNQLLVQKRLSMAAEKYLARSLANIGSAASKIGQHLLNQTSG